MAETLVTPVKTLSFEQLALARKRTQAVSDFLEKQLTGYLDTLQSLLLPERLLGKLAGSRSELPGLDKGLAEIQEHYKRFVGKPFDLPKDFEVDWLHEVGARLDLHHWEYSRDVTTESGKRPIQITSPTRWLLTYGPAYTVSQAVQAFGRRQDRRGLDQLRQFIVNALVMQALLARSTGLATMLADLRYDISTQPHTGLNGLPVTMIQSRVPAFLPPDAIIAAATELSGVPAFNELIDVDAARELPDPLRQRISELIQA